MLPYSAVIFDLDGTLLNTLDDLAASANHALAFCGYPTHTKDSIRGFIGNGVAQLIRRAAPSPIGDEAFAKVLAAFKNHYAAHNRVKTRPYDGIPEMLLALRQEGVQVGVVSNKNDENVKMLCQECLGVAIAIGERPGLPRKPAPDSVFEAMSQMNATVKNTLYVGDSPVDVKTAENAGLPCLCVTWGFSDEAELLGAGATHLAHAPADVVAFALGST